MAIVSYTLPLLTSSRDALTVSVRRLFVASFFHEQAARHIKGSGRVLDIGGKKFNRRDAFDIAATGASVAFVNIDPSSQPDIVADAASLPVPDATYDAAVMGELLEHVPNPRTVLREAHRILRPGGVLLATVPFLFPVHADPHDYGRYTDTFWRDASADAGFSVEHMERQGTLYAVVALAVQHFFQAPAATILGRLCKGAARRFVRAPLVSLLMRLDRSARAPLLQSWTTGYGFILRK